MRKNKKKKDISGIYPIKKSTEMSVKEFSRWWAFMESLKLIFDYADKVNLEVEEINMNTKRILDEYIDPISGDIQNDLENFLAGHPSENSRFKIVQ